MKTHKLIFILIVFAGFLVRAVSLRNNPAGFTPDEASFGYDAYSLIRTGKDQWGNTWPLVLKSFGDYKMPLYSYLAIPSVFFFGLSEFAVRLPSAVVGTLAIVATYFLARIVFDKKIALITAALLAISPWHIPLSRGAFEANLTTFFLPLGVYFMLRGIKKPGYMVYAAVALGLNLFTYHSARLVTPLVVVAVIGASFSQLKYGYRKYLPGALVFFAFAILGLYTLSVGSGARASTSTVFSLSENVFGDRVGFILAGEPVLLSRLFNNEATYILGKLVGNYVGYFSPEFLFTNGPREGTYGMLPGVGVLYLVEAIFIAVFVFEVVKKKINVPFWFWVWIFIAPLPAAISLGPGFAANRAAIMMPAVQIISAAGIYYSYKHLASRLSPNISKAIIATVFVFAFTVFAERYFYHQPANEAKAMIFGAGQVMKITNGVEGEYSEIIISKEISEPQIFVAFYNKVDPETFQLASKAWDFENLNASWVDQQPVYFLGKYTFKHIDWVADGRKPNVLIVTTPENVSDKANVIGRVSYPNGSPAYVLVDTKTIEFANIRND